MYEELSEIRQKCLNCHKCPLAASRTNIVFSDGVPNPKLMLIGEAPGFYEDQQGKPFVGKAGQLLDRIFASVGFTREKDIYICKHFPSNTGRQSVLLCDFTASHICTEY